MHGNMPQPRSAPPTPGRPPGIPAVPLEPHIFVESCPLLFSGHASARAILVALFRPNQRRRRTIRRPTSAFSRIATQVKAGPSRKVAIPASSQHRGCIAGKLTEFGFGALARSFQLTACPNRYVADRIVHFLNVPDSAIEGFGRWHIWRPWKGNLRVAHGEILEASELSDHFGDAVDEPADLFFCQVNHLQLAYTGKRAAKSEQTLTQNNSSANTPAACPG